MDLYDHKTTELRVAPVGQATSCKSCNGMSIGLYILAWSLYILIFIPVLFWSTQVFLPDSSSNSPNLVQKYRDFSILEHFEVHHGDPHRSYAPTILYSSVCPLGKASFYILVFLMLLYLMLISAKQFLKNSQPRVATYTFAGIFGFIFLLFLINWPLFVRSIPAMVAVAGILTIGICV